MLPISLAVFVQMLGVGVTLATLPLMMATQGYSPNQLGVTISCFSAAQMIGCPFLVSLSNKAGIGRLAVLRACLGGNALAAILTAASRSWGQITIARILAGFFAASVPVAQVAAADVSEPGPQTSKAISRVSSAASLGMIVGPAFGGLAAELSRRLFNVPPSLESRCAFAVSGVFAAIVLVLTAGVRLPGAKTSAVVSSGGSSSGSEEMTAAAATRIVVRVRSPQRRLRVVVRTMFGLASRSCGGSPSRAHTRSSPPSPSTPSSQRPFWDTARRTFHSARARRPPPPSSRSYLFCRG